MWWVGRGQRKTRRCYRVEVFLSSLDRRLNEVDLLRAEGIIGEIFRMFGGYNVRRVGKWSDPVSGTVHEERATVVSVIVDRKWRHRRWFFERGRVWRDVLGYGELLMTVERLRASRWEYPHRTDRKCKRAGEYESDCKCRSRVVLEVGLRFGSCVTCRRKTSWTLIRAIDA